MCLNELKIVVTTNYTIIFVYHAVSSTGEMTYSEVIAFLKKDPTTLIEYQLITTSYNESVILSGDHLIYARKLGSDEFNPM